MLSLEQKKRKCTITSSLLKALSHPQRLLLLCCLSNGEKTVTELEEICGSSQSVVSQHLGRMRLQGFVNARRKGNFVFYHICDTRIMGLIEYLEDVFSSDSNMTL